MARFSRLSLKIQTEGFFFTSIFPCYHHHINESNTLQCQSENKHEKGDKEIKKKAMKHNR